MRLFLWIPIKYSIICYCFENEAAKHAFLLDEWCDNNHGFNDSWRRHCHHQQQVGRCQWHLAQSWPIDLLTGSDELWRSKQSLSCYGSISLAGRNRWHSILSPSLIYCISHSIFSFSRSPCLFASHQIVFNSLFILTSSPRCLNVSRQPRSSLLLRVCLGNRNKTVFILCISCTFFVRFVSLLECKLR